MKAILGMDNEPYAQTVMNMLNERGGFYRSKQKGKLIYFGYRPRKFEIFMKSREIKATNYENPASYTSFRNSRGLDFETSPIASQQALDRLAKDIKEGSGIAQFQKMRLLVLLLPKDKFAEGVRDIIAPQFFKDYPSGRIQYTKTNFDINKSLGFLRVLGGIDKFADRDFSKLGKDIEQFGMLTSAQSAGVFDPFKYLEIPFALFLPKLYGFTASRITDSLLFLLDPIIPNIRDTGGLKFMRTGASRLFAQSQDTLADTYSLITQDFSLTEVNNFVSQFRAKLRSCIRFILNPDNFTYGDGRWIGLTHYRTWLVFERLANEVIFLLADDAPFIRKMTLFRILDQLATLVDEETTNQPDVFKELLIPDKNKDIIAEGLGEYNGPIASHLQGLLPEVRDELREVVLKSIYLPNRIDKKAGKVTLMSGEKVRLDEYVTNSVRELRNTHHGYHTREFDEYLAMSTGNTPDRLPLLGALAFLAMLAKPKLFFQRRWLRKTKKKK